MGKNKKISIKPISQKEMIELSEAYADCFSNNRKSRVWLDAFEENVSNCQKFNRELLKKRG